MASYPPPDVEQARPISPATRNPYELTSPEIRTTEQDVPYPHDKAAVYEKTAAASQGSESIEQNQPKSGVVKDFDLKAYDAEQDREEVEVERTSRTRHVWNIIKGPNSINLHIFIEILVTAWWIAGTVLHHYDIGWLKPFLIWLAISIRMLTFHISTKLVTTPIKIFWANTIQKAVLMIPAKFRLWLAAAGTVAVFLVGTFVGEEVDDNTRPNRAVSLFGLIIFIFVFYVTSKNRKAINWQTVIVGMLAQFIVAVFVLKSGAGFAIFNFISEMAVDLLGFSKEGTSFLISADFATKYGWFVLTVIPPIIFFVAFVQLLYHWGWLQFFIRKFATVFFWSMGVSGAEAVVAAASPFVGQGESAMLIKPFIQHLTSSELHAVMTAGFATIAGSVLTAYISFGISGQALVTSCVMSIPASLAMSKLRYPEEEEPLTANRIIIPESDDDEKSVNSLHAFGNGGWLGLIIAGRIVAGLLVVLSLLGLANGLLTYIGQYLSINDPPLTIQLMLSYLLFPLAFLLGVARQDILKVSKVIGTKIVANEFVAFIALTQDPTLADLTPRSRLIATFAVCGFGNISSLGIQIGILSQLAPGRSGRVAKVAFSALCTGIIATCTSASIAGMLISDVSAYTKYSPAT